MSLKASELKPQGVMSSSDGLLKVGNEVVGGAAGTSTGSWVEVESRSFADELVSMSIPWDATSDEFMIKVDCNLGADAIAIRFNEDATANYHYHEEWGTAVADSNTQNYRAWFHSGWDAMYPVAETRWADHSVADLTITGVTAKGGKRMVRAEGALYYSEGVYHGPFRSINIWNNTTDAVSSIYFGTTRAFTGKVKVYKWEAIKSANTATYELIGAYSVDGAPFDETFDVEDGDEIKVESTCQEPVVFTMNGDTSAAAYTRSYILTDNTQAEGIRASQSDTPYGTIGHDGALRCYAGRVTGSGTLHYKGDERYGHVKYESIWNSDEAPSLARLYTDASTTGTVKVYKLSKTHVLKAGYSLHKKFTFDGKHVDFTLDTSELDEEIMIKASGLASANINMIVNGITSYARNGYVGNTYVDSNSTTIPILFTSNTSRKSSSTVSLDIGSGISTNIGSYMNASSLLKHCNMTYITMGDPKVDSIEVSQEDGATFTGTISVYKL